MRIALGILFATLVAASCAVPPSATTEAPISSAPSSPRTANDDESGATFALSVGRSIVGRYKIALGFQDGRAFRLYWAFASDATVADVVNALAEDLRKKGLEVDVVPEFGTLRIAFTNGLFRIEASGPEGFTFESRVGKRDELGPDRSRFDAALLSDFEVVAPVASLRLLRFVEGSCGREGVFELRNLSSGTLYYFGNVADSPSTFEDQEWRSGERRRQNKSGCGNGTARFSLAPGAVLEFTDSVPEDPSSYLKSTRVGVYFEGVPGTLGRGVEVFSDLITMAAK